MSKTPTEEDIQTVLKMLEETQPEKATRADAIKTIESMKSVAKIIVDKVSEDLKSGKVTVNKKGEVLRGGEVISKSPKSSKKA
jgi:hypothetical protein